MAASLPASPPVLRHLLLDRINGIQLLRLPLLGYQFHSCSRRPIYVPRLVVRSAADDRTAVAEVEKELDRYIGNGNGSGDGLRSTNGTVDGAVHVVLEGNGASSSGSLVKYSGGYGASREEVEEDGFKEGERKKRVEEISKEDAWFKKAAESAAQAVAAGSLVNLATLLHFNLVRLPAISAYLLSAFFGLQVLFGLLKVKKLDKQEKLITGTA